MDLTVAGDFLRVVAIVDRVRHDAQIEPTPVSSQGCGFVAESGSRVSDGELRMGPAGEAVDLHLLVHESAALAGQETHGSMAPRRDAGLPAVHDDGRSQHRTIGTRGASARTGACDRPVRGCPGLAGQVEAPGRCGVGGPEQEDEGCGD